MVVLGAAFGSLGEDVKGMIEGNPDLEQVFTQTSGGASIVDAYFGTVLMISALIGTGFTVSSVTRLRNEETSLRVEPLVATPLGRVRWAASSLVTTVLGTVAVLVATGLGTGIAYAAVAQDIGQVWALTGATLAYLPAALVLGGIGVALFGWAPRLGGLVWAVLTVCVVIGWLGRGAAAAGRGGAAVAVRPDPAGAPGRARLDSAARAHSRRGRAHRSRAGRAAAARPRDRVRLSR